MGPMEFALIAAAVVIAGALIAITFILRRGTAAEEGGTVSRLNDEIVKMRSDQADLLGRLSQLTEAQTQAQASLGKSVNERLDQFSTRMGQSLTEQTTKTQENLANLQERLAVIDTAQKNITDLSGNMLGLQQILSDKQNRGAFGEFQLEEIVKDTLPSSVFVFQKALSNGKIPDCTILLDFPPGPLVIDSKFPLEAFQAIQAAETTSETDKARSAFKSDLRKHTRKISESYIIDEETAPVALMFVPSEAVFLEIHASHADVVREGHRQKVMIVSPNTVLATLITVRAIMKDVEMRKQAHVIQAEILKMMDDVTRLDDRVKKLGDHFRQANGDIELIQKSTKAIVRHGKNIAEVQLEEPESPKALPNAE